MTDTDWDEIRTYLERNLEVTHTKREPDTNAKRDQNKADTIDWTIDQMKQGPMQGGTKTDLPDFAWLFGGHYWQVIRNATRMRDPKCRICNRNPTQEIHHIRPRFLNGSDHPRNLIGLCFDCHDEVHRFIDSGIRNALNESISIKPPAIVMTTKLEVYE